MYHQKPSRNPVEFKNVAAGHWELSLKMSILLNKQPYIKINKESDNQKSRKVLNFVL